MYERGYGVTRNQRKAVALYKKAAEGGIAVAQFNYGEALFLGNGIKKDYIEAKKWLLIALDRGSKENSFKSIVMSHPPNLWVMYIQVKEFHKAKYKPFWGTEGGILFGEDIHFNSLSDFLNLAD